LAKADPSLQENLLGVQIDGLLSRRIGHDRNALKCVITYGLKELYLVSENKDGFSKGLSLWQES
jgi:hypothetical protein